MTRAAVQDWLSSILADVYKPRHKEGVKRWAAENVDVPASVSPDFPGLYDSERTPLVEIMFDFYESAEYDELIMPKSSQGGASQAGHVVICYDANFRGRDIILLLDSEPEAKRIGRKRIRPLLRNCQPLASKLGKDGDAGLSGLTIYLKGLAIYLLGSFSPSALANKTVGLAICDEVDNYPPSPKGESNALDLVRDRLKKVVGAKLIAFSKPKDEDTLIWNEYLSGTRHKCLVPCPICSQTAGELAGFQELVWEGVIFEDGKDASDNWSFEKIRKVTYYKCEHCNGRISERDKPWMIANRRWKATNTGEDGQEPQPRKMSAHFSDLYSLHPKDTWGQLAVEFIAAQGKTSKMMRFRRGRLGLPWKKERVEVKGAEIRKMISGYHRGQLPVEPDIVLMGTDSQKHVKKWVKAGFVGSDCYVIDWGETLSFPGLLTVADEKVNILNWPDSTPKEKRIDPIVYKGLIDEGGVEKNYIEVRDFVVSTYLGQLPNGTLDYRFYSSYGRGGLSVKNWRDIFERRPLVHRGWPLEIYRFNDDAFKTELYEQRFAKFQEITRAIKAGEPIPDIPRVYFPATIAGDGPVSFDEFANELIQEKREFDPEKKTLKWIDPTEPNDYGDALKLCFVAWYVLQPLLSQIRARRNLTPAKNHG